jgi:hypothetical protein
MLCFTWAHSLNACCRPVPVPSFYGMHVAATARESVDLERLTDSLLRQDVKIHSLKRYFLGPPTHAGLVFGFGALGCKVSHEALCWCAMPLPSVDRIQLRV